MSFSSHRCYQEYWNLLIVAGVQNRLNGFESNQTDLHVTKVLKSTSSSSLFNIHLMKNQTRVLTAASASKTAPSIQTRKEKAKKLAAKKQKKAMIKNKTKANFKLSKKEDIFVDPRSAPTRKTADCGKHRCGKKKMQRKNVSISQLTFTGIGAFPYSLNNP